MDAFFAAIEQRDHPEYVGKPIIVGGNPSGRGVVATASYEARKFGIKSAMPAAQAKRLCPQAIFLKPNFKQYSDASDEIHAIFRKYTAVVESAGLDEAYLDVTENSLKIDDPVLLAKMIQQHIRAATRLSASCGVAPNKFLAKIASDMKKPFGLTVVFPNQVQVFLKDLSVRKIPGVGPKTEKELEHLNIRTVSDLLQKSREELAGLFGKWGHVLHERARGIDHSPVEPYGEPKQIGSEETFERDYLDMTKLEAQLVKLADEVSYYLKQSGVRAKTVTLKVKYSDFTVITRSRTLTQLFDDGDMMAKEAIALLRTKTEAGRRPIRLLGVSASHFDIFEEEETQPKTGNLFSDLVI